MPADPTNDRLMAEVHYYDPYDFALQTSSGYKTGWGEIPGYNDRSTWGQESWVNTAFGYMKTTFVDKGIPVILGEYGAIYRSSLTDGILTNHIESLNYYLNYLTSKAMKNGMCPFTGIMDQQKTTDLPCLTGLTEHYCEKMPSPQ